MRSQRRYLKGLIDDIDDADDKYWLIRDAVDAVDVYIDCMQSSTLQSVQSLVSISHANSDRGAPCERRGSFEGLPAGELTAWRLRFMIEKKSWRRRVAGWSNWNGMAGEIWCPTLRGTPTFIGLYGALASYCLIILLSYCPIILLSYYLNCPIVLLSDYII